MAKIDKSNHSKEEYRRLKGQEKAKKRALKSGEAPAAVAVEPSVKINNPQPLPDNIYILCVKHGIKYSAEYVNKLHSMVSRHCSLPFEFCCLTDDSTGINPNIQIIPLPKHLEGWWCKPYIFSDLPIKGRILYLDLDVVISDNIDRLFVYAPDSWCIIRDFTRQMRPDWQKYNSSVVRFDTGQLQHLWENYSTNWKDVQAKFFGDQDWLYSEALRTGVPATLFPDNWIRSWKWEIRLSKEFKPGRAKGNRTFKDIEHVEPPKDCVITVFHGDPNPHNCNDPWVVNNWK